MAKNRVQDGQQKALIESLEKGNSITEACDQANVSRGTYYNWRAQYPEWAAQCDNALKLQVNVVEDALYEKACNGNTTAMIFYLCNRAPSDWRHVAHIEHTGGGGGPIQHTFDPSQLSTAQLRDMEALLEVGAIGGDEPRFTDPLHGNGGTMGDHKGKGRVRSSHNTGKSKSRPKPKAGKSKGK